MCMYISVLDASTYIFMYIERDGKVERYRYCFLLIAYCLLPIAYCILPIAYPAVAKFNMS